jgi:hypothetical protein
VLVGELSLQQEQRLIAATKTWLEERAADVRGYQIYLDSWADWENPWEEG